MKTTKSTQAQAAQLIRTEIKAAFQGMKFSIRSRSYAGGDAVDVSWTDGPTTKEVDKIVGKYQRGHFDGMTDMYEYSNSRDDIPQVKYVMTSRRQSEATKLALTSAADRIFPESNQWGERNAIHRIFQNTSLPADAIVTGIERTKKMAGLITDMYKVVYTVPTLLMDGVETTLADWLYVNTEMPDVDHVSERDAERVKSLKVGESTHVGLFEIKLIA